MTLEDKKKQRWLMLRKFYELTNGHANAYLVDLWEVGKELGWDAALTEATYDYLEGERLVKSMTLGGGATITHQGVKEVEEAEEHPNQPTLHFPPFVVNITGKSEVVHGDRFEVNGDVVGAALGRDARSQSGNIALYQHKVNQSGFDPDLTRTLIEARKALEHEPISDNDKADASDDLTKVTDELTKQVPDSNRVKRLWKRIKELAPTAAAILSSAASFKKLLRDNE